jgi:hypothetical protein
MSFSAIKYFNPAGRRNKTTLIIVKSHAIGSLFDCLILSIKKSDL